MNFENFLENITILKSIIAFQTILLFYFLFYFFKNKSNNVEHKIRNISYTPSYFSNSDLNEIYDTINKISLGLLVVSDSKGNMISSLIPMTIKKSKDNNQNYGILYGHISKKNDIINLFGEKCLVSFLGNHGYITPKYYGKNSNKFVPTWNYELVECKGILEKVYGVDKDHLFRELIHHQESKINGNDEWNMDKDISKEIIDPMKGEIEWFRIEIKEIQGRFKLSQNRTKEIRNDMIERIEKKNQNLAETMKKF